MNLCNNYNYNKNNNNSHKSVAPAIVEVLPDRRQWKVYILLVSHRAFLAFHMPLPLPLPLPHALGLVLAFYSIESWILQTFATSSSPSSIPLQIELMSTAAVHVNCPMHRPNHKYIQASLPLPSTFNPFLPFFSPLHGLHWMRFQNCKLNLLNLGKLQQQEANRQRLAKVLPKVCNQL